MRTKYKITFGQIMIRNRWKQKRWSRNCDWTPFGFHIHWFGPESYSWQICLFGIDIIIWWNRTFIDNP
jgi:hypothetical protein